MDISLSNLIHKSGQNFIMIAPIVKEIAGSENSARVITRLEYWFSKYQNGFYKFLEQCDHALCRAGDSWSDEVGLSRKTFNKAFDLIGIRYSSKTAFLKAADKFQGKMYASYYDRKTNRMYYVRNHDLVKDIFAKFFDKLTGKNSARPPKAVKEVVESLPSSSRSCNGQNGRSFARASENILKQRNTSTSPYPQTSANAEAIQTDEGVIDNIIKIWNDYLPKSIQTGTLTKREQRSLLILVKTNLENNLEKWKNLCVEVSNNDFLTGKSSKVGWKITLNWLSRPENFAKILQGNYGLNIDKIMTVEQTEQDLLAKIETEETNSSVVEFRKQILARAGAPSYKSWFEKVQISRLEGQGGYVISSVTNFWKTYVENHFRWIKELGIDVEIITV